MVLDQCFTSSIFNIVFHSINFIIEFSLSDSMFCESSVLHLRVGIFSIHYQNSLKKNCSLREKELLGFDLLVAFSWVKVGPKVNSKDF